MNAKKRGCDGPSGGHGPKGDSLVYFLKLFWCTFDWTTTRARLAMVLDLHTRSRPKLRWAYPSNSLGSQMHLV
jgi:hypothetical protein